MGPGGYRGAVNALRGMLNAVQMLLILTWTAVWITLALLLLAVTFNRDLPLVLARRVWGPGVLRLAGARLRVEPLPDLDWSRPYIFVMNHQSALDICCAFSALPANLRFVAKHTLAKVPFLGWYMWATGMVFINRSNRFQAVESLRRAGVAIRAGKSILMYPEGTRSHAPFAIQSFKGGPFALAVEAQVALVPVAVEGTGRVMSSAGLRMQPGAVRLKVGAAISTEGKRDRDALMDETRRALVALHRELGGASSDAG